MPPHPLTNFEMQKCQNEPKFNIVYSRYDLTKVHDGGGRGYLIKLDEYKSIGIHWIAYVCGLW